MINIYNLTSLLIRFKESLVTSEYVVQAVIQQSHMILANDIETLFTEIELV